MKISKMEYEELVRDSERLRTVETLLMRKQEVSRDVILAVCGYANEVVMFRTDGELQVSPEPPSVLAPSRDAAPDLPMDMGEKVRLSDGRCVEKSCLQNQS